MTIAGIRAALKAALETISGLTVFSQMPDDPVKALPCAIIDRLSGRFNALNIGGHSHRYAVTLVLGRQGDIAEAETSLEAYLEPSGASSVKTALEAANLSTHGKALIVIGDTGLRPMPFNQQVYLTVTIEVEVYS